MVDRDSSCALPKLLSLLVAVACSSPPNISARDAADANDTGATLVAKNEAERSVLRQLSQLPAGRPSRVGDETVVADIAYVAASGRTCRALRLATSSDPKTWEQRLACKDAQHWFFVPDIFGVEDHGAGE
jgi:hypothetical protein